MRIIVSADAKPKPVTKGDDWREQAACRDKDPELFFPIKQTAAAEVRAKAVCRRCPVDIKCLVTAIRNGHEHGIWGGMNEEERAAIVRNRNK